MTRDGVNSEGRGMRTLTAVWAVVVSFHPSFSDIKWGEFQGDGEPL